MINTDCVGLNRSEWNRVKHKVQWQLQLKTSSKLWNQVWVEIDRKVDPKSDKFVKLRIMIFLTNESSK